MFSWTVMKLCERQLRDVNPADVLEGGLYRKCDTYKGGGGYDRFSTIFERRFGHVLGKELNDQFVVQLRGCPLRCPYCYVTDEGVNSGESVDVSTKELVDAFRRSGCSVFHLMGGAPALHLPKWVELVEALDGAVFHSDFLLVERTYSTAILRKLSRIPNSLYAVSIKGADAGDFEANTGVPLNEKLFWYNFDELVDSGLQFYLTFTGMSDEGIKKFSREVERRYGPEVLEDSFPIELVEYDALKD